MRKLTPLPLTVPACVHHRYHGDRYGCACDAVPGDRCEPAYADAPELSKCPSFKRAYRKGERAARPAAKLNGRTELPCIHLGEALRLNATLILSGSLLIADGKYELFYCDESNAWVYISTESVVLWVDCHNGWTLVGVVGEKEAFRISTKKTSMFSANGITASFLMS